LAAPPGEEFQQKLFHPISAAVRKCLAVMPSAGRIVQPQPRHITACHPVDARNVAESAQSVHRPYSCALTGYKSRTSGAWLGNAYPILGLACMPEKEPRMTNLKVLSAVAALALPLAFSSAAVAQTKFGVPSSVGGVPTGAGDGRGSVTYPSGGTTGGGGGYRGGVATGG
ncbi:hypothetical protein KXV85_004926, partial [Aspergillus fumigatus]